MIVFSGATFKERRIAARVERALLGVLGQKDIFAVDAAMAGEEDIRALKARVRTLEEALERLTGEKFVRTNEPFPAEDAEAGRGGNATNEVENNDNEQTTAQ